MSIIFYCLAILSCRQTSAPKTNPENEYLAPIVPLDSLRFDVDEGLSYKIYVYSNNTYSLFVNNSDSMQIGPFIWEEGQDKGFIFENSPSKTCVSFDGIMYLIALPVGMGVHKIVYLYKQNNAFYIDKRDRNPLYSESRYYVIPDKHMIAIPIVRMKDAGKVEYWRYNFRLKQMDFFRKKYVDEGGSDDYVYQFEDPAYVKKIIHAAQ